MGTLIIEIQNLIERTSANISTSYSVEKAERYFDSSIKSSIEHYKTTDFEQLGQAYDHFRSSKAETKSFVNQIVHGAPASHEDMFLKRAVQCLRTYAGVFLIAGVATALLCRDYFKRDVA